MVNETEKLKEPNLESYLEICSGHKLEKKMEGWRAWMRVDSREQEKEIEMERSRDFGKETWKENSKGISREREMDHEMEQAMEMMSQQGRLWAREMESSSEWRKAAHSEILLAKLREPS